MVTIGCGRQRWPIADEWRRQWSASSGVQQRWQPVDGEQLVATVTVIAAANVWRWLKVDSDNILEYRREVVANGGKQQFSFYSERYI